MKLPFSRAISRVCSSRKTNRYCGLSKQSVNAQQVPNVLRVCESSSEIEDQERSSEWSVWAQPKTHKPKVVTKLTSADKESLRKLFPLSTGANHSVRPLGKSVNWQNCYWFADYSQHWLIDTRVCSQLLNGLGFPYTILRPLVVSLFCAGKRFICVRGTTRLATEWSNSVGYCHQNWAIRIGNNTEYVATLRALCGCC